jgi:hypothetical protein
MQQIFDEALARAAAAEAAGEPSVAERPLAVREA